MKEGTALSKLSAKCSSGIFILESRMYWLLALGIARGLVMNLDPLVGVDKGRCQYVGAVTFNWLLKRSNCYHVSCYINPRDGLWDL